MDFTTVYSSSSSFSSMKRSGMSSLDLSQLSLATGASTSTTTTASSSTNSLASAATNGHNHNHNSHHAVLHSGWGSVHSRAAYTDLSLLHQQQSFAARSVQPHPHPHRTLSTSAASRAVQDSDDDDDEGGWGYFVDTPDNCFSHS